MTCLVAKAMVCIESEGRRDRYTWWQVTFNDNYEDYHFDFGFRVACERMQQEAV